MEQGSLAEVRLDPSSPQPLPRQLYLMLRQAMLDGRLSPGQRLPPTRMLAQQLGAARATVVSAYEQLLAEGYLSGRVGAGTFVSLTLSEAIEHGAQHEPASPLLSRRGMALAAEAPPVSDEGEPRPFRAAQPALDQFPSAVWARCAARLYRRPPRELLSYGASAGYGPLREAIAAYVHTARALRCQPEQVIIVAGVQQALDLAARVLLDPADTVWVEDPGFGGARAAFEGVGATIASIPVDTEGLNVIQGMALHPAARLAYVTPAHQFPLGVTMSLPRRLALLAWARHSGAWVLEDDYDAEFRYDGYPPAALASLDKVGQVIYLGTFSTLLFPALRLGYIIVPSAVSEAFVRARALAGRHAPTLEQAVLASFIAEGHFDRHLRAMRELYQERQATFIARASQVLGERLRLEPSAAGMDLIGWLPPGTADEVVAARAAQMGVEARALSTFALRQQTAPGLLLGYTAFNEVERDEGLQRLALAL